MSSHAENGSSFATTRWSMVVAAGQVSSPSSAEALAHLCRTYWYPLYAFVRRRVADVNLAQDLTQDFFARLLEKNLLAVAQPERGKFRAFLLTALKNFLANEVAKQRTHKRGGSRLTLSLDFDIGEDRFRREPAHHATPERHFARQWALALLDQVLLALRNEYEDAGKAAHFDRLKPFLGGGETTLSLADVAGELGLTEGAAKVAAHRLRRRYRDLLRAEVTHTLAEGEAVDDEIRWLFGVLAGD